MDGFGMKSGTNLICTDPSCDCRAAVAYRASTPAAPAGPAWCTDPDCRRWVPSSDIKGAVINVHIDPRPHMIRDHVR